MAEKDLGADVIRQRVAEFYAGIARQDTGCGCSPAPDCCGTQPAGKETVSTGLGYSPADLDKLPAGADMGLGCGNPVALAELKAGEVVLDLGSGGGIDCFIAARQVGTSGRVVGVDMTPDMVVKARRNATATNAGNVEFRLGELEHLPVADASVDVIISNCVINLSPDKRQTFKEAFRVLKPGGRLAISDIVATKPVPDDVRRDSQLWASCIAGAMDISELERLLKEVGFSHVTVKPLEIPSSVINDCCSESQHMGVFASANIKAVKAPA